MNIEELKTGDIILVGGTSWLNKRIKKITKSRYSHIGIIYRAYDEILVVEQDRTGFGGAGLICTNINNYFNGKYDILLRRPNFYVDGSEYGKEFLKDLGRFRYSYFDLIVAQPILQLTGRWIGGTTMNDGRTVCSGYVAYIFDKFEKLYPKWYKMTPAQFENDENFVDL